MLLKVVYILLGYLLVDGFFLNTYGANVSLTFKMEDNVGRTCTVTNHIEKGDLIVKNVTVHAGDRMELTFEHMNFMNVIECTVISVKEQRKKKIIPILDDPKTHSDPLNGQLYVQKHVIDEILDADEGEWYCKIFTLRDNSQLATFPHNGHKYVRNKCYVTVFVRSPIDDTDAKPAIPSLWIYVGIGVGVLVLVVIIAQTGVILYLKYKAQKTARLDSLSLRPHDRDETDTKRYSKPPGVKMSRFSRMLRRSTTNDESIYETLEELRNTGKTPPVPPIENIPTLKKKQSQNPEETSKSLPRPNKARPPPNFPATLHRIPGRGRSPELDISKRPPLPLPTELPEERSAIPSRNQRTPFAPIEEDGQSTTHTLTRPIRPVIGQSSVAYELDNVFKMRKASLTTQSAKNILPAAPKKHSFPNLRGKPKLNKANDLNDSAEHNNFEAETTHPLPTGKSAALLGLAPVPVPKTTNNKAGKPASVKPGLTSSTPLKPTVTSKTPIKTPASTATVSKAPVKPPAGSVMLPRPSITNMAPTKAPVTPSKPASAVKLPKPSMTAVKTAGASLKPVPLNKHQLRPVPQLPVGKPPPLPPPEEPTQEAVYEESEQPFYHEEEMAPLQYPPKFEKPTPQLPMASIGKPPPLPPPNRPKQEDEYEEFAEEPVYNSDDEWVYEPLQKYNIYSN